jgi:hypothetical protein
MIKAVYPLTGHSVNWKAFLYVAEKLTGRSVLDEANVSTDSALAYPSALANLEKKLPFAASLKDNSLLRHMHYGFLLVMNHELAKAVACCGCTSVNCYPSQGDDDIVIISGTMDQWVRLITNMLKVAHPDFILFAKGMYRIFDTMDLSRLFPESVKLGVS